MIDGVGIFMLLRQLFAKAAQIYKLHLSSWDYPLPDDDDHLSRRLSPSLRTAANIPELLSPDLQNYFNKHNEANTKLHSRIYSGALTLKSFLPTRTSTDRVKRIAITAPKAVSNRVLSSASDSGSRVSHLFTAASAIALADSQTRGKDYRRLAYYFHRPVINLRSSLSPDHAAGLYSSFATQALVLNLRIPKQGDSQQSYLNDITTLADSIQQHETATEKEVHELKEKQSGANPEAMIAPWNFKALHYSPDFDEDITSPVAPVSLSLFGLIDSRFHTDDDFFEIPTVWTASQPIKAGIAAYLSIWKGEIELSAVFNTRFHDEAIMEGFLWGIYEHVFKGLGMSGYELEITR